MKLQYKDVQKGRRHVQRNTPNGLIKEHLIFIYKEIQLEQLQVIYEEGLPNI
jgi:hypothetical protein